MERERECAFGCFDCVISCFGSKLMISCVRFRACSPQTRRSCRRLKPHSMSSQCYACTDPGSIASTHAYFLHPEASWMYMHTSCFLEFAADYETQTNLRDVLHAWALCSRQGANSLRSMRALECVLRWQREQREKWKASRADTMYTRALGRRTFTQWAPTPPPSLIDSSVENDDRFPPPMIDSSSESD